MTRVTEKIPEDTIHACKTHDIDTYMHTCCMSMKTHCITNLIDLSFNKSWEPYLINYYSLLVSADLDCIVLLIFLQCMHELEHLQS